MDDRGFISEQGQWTVTAEKAHAVLTDPSNEYLVVPHTGPNAVYVFGFDPLTGEMVPNEPAYFQTPPGSGPRHAVFHPHKPIVYTVNEQGGSVTTWRTNFPMQTLSSIETLSTLPENFSADNACADLELTPNAKWLFASNRGHNSLACFQVDSDNGRLRSVARTATETTPRQFSITPDGRHLYAAGQASGNLATYEIDDATGELTKINSMSVGKRPWWVLSIDLP